MNKAEVLQGAINLPFVSTTKQEKTDTKHQKTQDQLKKSNSKENNFSQVKMDSVSLHTSLQHHP